jgi:hypothetical protein
MPLPSAPQQRPVINVLSPHNPNHLCILSVVLGVIGQHVTTKSPEEVQAYTHPGESTIYVAANKNGESLIAACEVLLTAIHPGGSNALMEAARILHVLFSETDRVINQNIPEYELQESWLKSNQVGNKNGNWATDENSKLVRWKFLDRAPIIPDTKLYVTNMPSKTAEEKAKVAEKILELTYNPRLNTKQLNNLLNLVKAFKEQKPLPRTVVLSPITKITNTPPTPHALQYVENDGYHAEISLMRALIIGSGFKPVIKGNLGGKKAACAKCSAWFSKVKTLSADQIDPSFPNEAEFGNLRPQRQSPTNWAAPKFSPHVFSSTDFTVFKTVYEGAGKVTTSAEEELMEFT